MGAVFLRRITIHLSLLAVLVTFLTGSAPPARAQSVDDSVEAVAQLQARGVEAVEFWRGPHPACDVRQFPDVAWLRKSVVEIPCHQDIPLRTLGRVAEIVREVLTSGAHGCYTSKSA
jgi:hypothetical protein